MATEAAELTPQEKQQWAEQAHQLNESIKKGLRQGRQALWNTAEALAAFDEAKGWSALGYETQAEWLADPEIGLTRATYFRMVSSFRYLASKGIARNVMDELEMSKVDMVIPSIKQGRKTLEEALGDVRQMGKRDLREEYLGHREGPTGGTDDDVEGTATEAPVEAPGEPAEATNGSTPTDDTPKEPQALRDALVAWGEAENTGARRGLLEAGRALADAASRYVPYEEAMGMEKTLKVLQQAAFQTSDA